MSGTSLAITWSLDSEKEREWDKDIQIFQSEWSRWRTLFIGRNRSLRLRAQRNFLSLVNTDENRLVTQKKALGVSRADNISPFCISRVVHRLHFTFYQNVKLNSNIENPENLNCEMTFRFSVLSLVSTQENFHRFQNFISVFEFNFPTFGFWHKSMWCVVVCRQSFSLQKLVF